MKPSNNFAFKNKFLLRKYWTTWMKHKEIIKMCCQPLFFILFHSPVRTHSKSKYPHNIHKSEFIYITQEGGHVKPCRIFQFQFYDSNTKSKNCITTTKLFGCNITRYCIEVLCETEIPLPSSLTPSELTRRNWRISPTTQAEASPKT